RSDAVAALEVLVECALVVEADGGRHVGQHRLMPQMTAGDIEPNLGQVGMRRQADRSFEQADKLEGRQVHLCGQVLEPRVASILRPHTLDRASQELAIGRRQLDAVAATAVALEQLAESSN